MQRHSVLSFPALLAMQAWLRITTTSVTTWEHTIIRTRRQQIKITQKSWMKYSSLTVLKFSIKTVNYQKNLRFYHSSPNPKSLTCLEEEPPQQSPVLSCLSPGQRREKPNPPTARYLQCGTRSNQPHRGGHHLNERRSGHQGRIILRLRNLLRSWPSTSPATPSGKWTEQSRKCPPKRNLRN